MQHVEALRSPRIDVCQGRRPIEFLFCTVVVECPGRVTHKPERLAVLPLEVPFGYFDLPVAAQTRHRRMEMAKKKAGGKKKMKDLSARKSVKGGAKSIGMRA